MKRRCGPRPPGSPDARPKRLVFCADLDTFAADAPLWGGALSSEAYGDMLAGEAPDDAFGAGEAPRGALSGERLREALAGEALREALASEGEGLREALARALTDKQREVVEMHFFEGLSQGEIARRLGVSQQVVQKRLHGDRRAGKMVGGALPRLREALRAPRP